jgi:hypothetical protein
MSKYVCSACGEELEPRLRDSIPLQVPEAGLSLYGPFWIHKKSRQHCCEDNAVALEDLPHVIIGQLAIEVDEPGIDSPMDIEIVEVVDK